MNRYDNERLSAIAVLESLRAGVPTRASTKALPDLRPNLLEIFKEDLKIFAGGQNLPGKFVWGKYGQGKTHVLASIEHLALDMGFAVSRVSLSREVSCHNLFHFYSKVAVPLRTPNSTVFGLQRLINQKTESELLNSPIQNEGRYVHPLPALIFEDYFRTEGEEQDTLYGYLMGNPPSDFKSLHKKARGEKPILKLERKFKPSEHATAFFGVLADAICFCGFKGWIILIDELELVARLGKISRLNAYRNLNWLLNWSGAMTYPIYTVCAAATDLQDEFWYPTDLKRMADSREIPLLAEERFGKIVSEELQKFFKMAVGPSNPQIKPVAEDDLINVLTEVVKLYKLAYKFDPQINLKELIQHIGNQPIRTHLRATLEALDIQYLYQKEILPDASLPISASLEEQTDFFSEL